MGRYPAACAPCRRSKLSCDHSRPVCARCRNTAKADSCSYQERTPRPAKSRQPLAEASPCVSAVQLPSVSIPVSNDNVERQLGAIDAEHHLGAPTAQDRTRYPNPGFQGSLSSLSIFGQVAPQNQAVPQQQIPQESVRQNVAHQLISDREIVITQLADSLLSYLQRFPLKRLCELTAFWLAGKVNLALAGTFVTECVQSVSELQDVEPHSGWHARYTERLLSNSRSPLTFGTRSTVLAFSSQFTGPHARLETLGIFFSAVIGASNAISFFPALFENEDERHHLRNETLHLSDQTLDFCVYLDCMNDLQLLLQYENFIAHSHIDGDQSYQSWRRLGDVISSLMALGYHEKREVERDCPEFLIQVRRCAFARVFSADKNLAIFLGRPPRLLTRFCHYELPRSCVKGDVANDSVQVNYISDSCWSALCAQIKEEVLELLCVAHTVNRLERISTLQSQAEHIWRCLPIRNRLEGNLVACEGTTFERDFAASARLNILHVHYLLCFVQMDNLGAADNPIFEVALKMLRLVLEVILQRDRLANSGTGLVWKVVHYGLPASGILLLALMKSRGASHIAGTARSDVVHSLKFLVAEVEQGALSSPRQPNFALLSKAAQTIQICINSEEAQPELSILSEDRVTSLDQNWISSFDFDLDASFWDSLMQHSTLHQPNLGDGTLFGFDGRVSHETDAEAFMPCHDGQT